jgi:hypothetical protein
VLEALTTFDCDDRVELIMIVLRCDLSISIASFVLHQSFD